MTLKVELAQSGVSKSVTTFFEALVSEFVNALKSQSKLKSVHDNSNSYSALANPAFNGLLISAAPDLKAALVDKQSFQYETNKKLNAINSITSKLYGSSKSKIALKKSLGSLGPDFDMLAVSEDGQHTFSNLQMLERTKSNKYSTHTASYLVSNQVKSDAELSLSSYLNSFSISPLIDSDLAGNTYSLSKSEPGKFDIKFDIVGFCAAALNPYKLNMYGFLNPKNFPVLLIGVLIAPGKEAYLCCKPFRENKGSLL